MPDKIEAEPAPIFEVRQYVNESGQQILMKCRLTGEVVEYIGQAHGRINQQNGPPDMWTYGFKIEANTIEEAFANLTAANKEAWPRILAERISMHKQQAETARKKIVMPVGQLRPGRPLEIKV